MPLPLTRISPCSAMRRCSTRAAAGATLAGSGPVSVAHHALAVPVQAGKLDAANGPYVLRLLDAAIDALAGRYDAIVTAPLQKSTINDAGVPFTGHTEYLAERTHTPRVVMMLAGTTGRCASRSRPRTCR